MHIHYLAMIGEIDEFERHLSSKPTLLNALEKPMHSTPLMVAIASAQLAIAKFLLSFLNIDIYVKDRNGRNVLHFLLLGIVDAKSEERGAYYRIAEMILQIDAQRRVRDPKTPSLLKMCSESMDAALTLVTSYRNEEIRYRILNIARTAIVIEINKLPEPEKEEKKVLLRDLLRDEDVQFLQDLHFTYEQAYQIWQQSDCIEVLREYGVLIRHLVDKDMAGALIQLAQNDVERGDRMRVFLETAKLHYDNIEVVKEQLSNAIHHARILNEGKKLNHWSFSSLLSMCGIWGKKHDRRSTLSELQESEPEREKLLEKKTV